MREFGRDYLFKISLEPTNSWSRYANKKLKPIYVVQPNKNAAREYAEKHLKDGISIRAVSLLAEQYGGSMFGSAGA